MSIIPFHIALPGDNLDAAHKFYGTTLGCPEDRSSSQWIDFDLFGHQIVAHLKPSANGDTPHLDPVAAMFFLDPAGSVMEFKALTDISQLFAK